MQPIYISGENNKPEFAGSCFRLWADNHFITAAHCVEGSIPENICIFDIMQQKFLPCVNIFRHPSADLAVIEIAGQVSSKLEKFVLAECKCTFGENVHCFGALSDWRKTFLIDEIANARVIGGIVQRFFEHNSGQYSSPVFELSAPIPKGMSGGPAFNAKQSVIAVGVSIGTIKSDTIVSEIIEYEGEKQKVVEKISEVVRYGVVLRLFEFTDWLKGILPEK